MKLMMKFSVTISLLCLFIQQNALAQEPVKKDATAEQNTAWQDLLDMGVHITLSPDEDPRDSALLKPQAEKMASDMARAIFGTMIETARPMEYIDARTRPEDLRLYEPDTSFLRTAGFPVGGNLCKQFGFWLRKSPPHFPEEYMLTSDVTRYFARRQTGKKCADIKKWVEFPYSSAHISETWVSMFFQYIDAWFAELDKPYFCKKYIKSQEPICDRVKERLRQTERNNLIKISELLQHNTGNFIATFDKHEEAIKKSRHWKRVDLYFQVSKDKKKAVFVNEDVYSLFPESDGEKYNQIKWSR